MQKSKVYLPKPLLYVLILGLVLRIFFLFYYKQLWWDSAVYVGMGKYLFSDGVLGIWETLRPVVLPVILGFFWKLKFDVVLAGRIFGILISLASVYLSFFIGKKLFNEKVALLAAFLLAITPTFLFFGSMILSGPLALFFLLFGIYLFIEKREFWAGIFFGLAFVTRFSVGLVFAAAIVVLIVYVIAKKDDVLSFFKKLGLLFLGFVIPVIPFLLYNHQRYGNILEPFLEANRVFSITNISTYTSAGYYWQNMVFENIFIYLAVISMFFVFRKKQWEKLIVVLSAVFLFVSFAVQGHKEIRFFITFFPFLYLLAAEGVFYVDKWFRTKRVRGFLVVVIVVAVVSTVAVSMASLTNYDYTDNYIKEKEYYGFFEGDEGTVLASSPVPVAYINNPLVVIYRVPFEGMLESYMQDADYAMINKCELFCPVSDMECPGHRADFMHELREYDILYDKELLGCQHLIIKK
ncbi:MAG: glycosyltransferase family 39 protein [archaeon]